MIKMPEIGKGYHIYGEGLSEVASWGVSIIGAEIYGKLCNVCEMASSSNWADNAVL
jgi:hypothetical protein